MLSPKYEIHTKGHRLIVCVGRTVDITYFSEPSCNLGLLDNFNRDIWQLMQVLRPYRFSF